MSDYKDILNTSWDEIPEPEVLPLGSWLLRVKGAKYFEPNEEKETSARVMFILGAKEPMNDVSQAELEALTAKNYDITQNRIFYTIWMEDGAAWQQVRVFLKRLGVDLSGKSPKESLKDARGKEIVGFLDTRTYTNGAGAVVTENVISSFAQPE